MIETTAFALSYFTIGWLCALTFVALIHRWRDIMAIFKKKEKPAEEVFSAEVQDTSEISKPAQRQEMPTDINQEELIKKFQQLDVIYKAYADKYAGLYDFANPANEMCSLLLGILTELKEIKMLNTELLKRVD